MASTIHTGARPPLTTPGPLVVRPPRVIVEVVIRRSNCVGFNPGMPRVLAPAGKRSSVPLALRVRAPMLSVALPDEFLARVIWPPLETVTSPIFSTDCSDCAPLKRKVPPLRSMPVASAQRPCPPATCPHWSLMTIWPPGRRMKLFALALVALLKKEAVPL